MSGDNVEVGDKASWSWGGNAPSGVVAEKKAEGEVSVTSHRGNTISKEGKPDDPAVALERSGNNVVKKASELEVEEKNAKPEIKEKAKGSKGTTPAKGTKRKQEEEPKKDDSNGDKKDEEKKDEDKKDDDEEKAEDDGDEQTEDTKKGKKDAPAEKKKPGRPAKAKTADKPKENGEKKKPGRPPKDPNAPPAAKRQKKEPREGTRKSSRIRN